ncbi:MAG: transposase, partial [Erysipelotrichales bacterium]
IKSNWKQLLMFEDDLNDTKYYNHRSFDYMVTTKMVVDYIVNLDEEFKETYNLYQSILRCFKYDNKDKYQKLIKQDTSNVSSYMQTAIKTLVKHDSLVIESMTSEYSNGPIEGINNKIKVIKRVSYGYRSFLNFKLRIMICFNLIKKA